MGKVTKRSDYQEDHPHVNAKEVGKGRAKIKETTHSKKVAKRNDMQGEKKSL